MWRNCGVITEEVRSENFPAPEHCYGIKQAELDQFTADVEPTIPTQSSLSSRNPVAVGEYAANSQR